MNIETERLILRRPAPRDWKTYRAFGMSARADVFPSIHKQPGAIWTAFSAFLGHWEIFGYGLWAVTRKDSDQILGLIGPYTPAHWPETEIGWMILDANIEGTGIASEAAKASIDDAYSRLGWETIVHYIHPDNHRSIALAERLGSKLDPEAPQPLSNVKSLVYRQPKPQAGASST